MKKKRILSKVMPICLTTAIAFCGGIIFTRNSDSNLHSFANLFGDIDGDGSINASDAAEILMYASWRGAGNEGDLVYFESLRQENSPTEAIVTSTETTELPIELIETTTEASFDDEYGYYDLLAEEVEKTGSTKSVTLTNLQDDETFKTKTLKNSLAIQNNKIIFRYGQQTIYVYDRNSKELHSFNLESESVQDVAYCNGYIYAYYNLGSESGSLIKKYSLDGKEVGSGKGSYQGMFYYISDSGYIFHGGNNIATGFYYTPDFVEKTTPKLSNCNEWRVMASYQNKIYVSARMGSNNSTARKIFYFDTETELWTDTGIWTDMGARSYYVESYNLFGKYWLTCLPINENDWNSSMVYDMEKDTMIARKLPRGFVDSYYGGKFNISFFSDYFRTARFAAGAGEDCAFSGNQLGVYSYSYPSVEEVVPIDALHYIRKDTIGIYLTTFAEGNDGEETILIFNS